MIGFLPSSFGKPGLGRSKDVGHFTAHSNEASIYNYAFLSDKSPANFCSHLVPVLPPFRQSALKAERVQAVLAQSGDGLMHGLRLAVGNLPVKHAIEDEHREAWPDEQHRVVEDEHAVFERHSTPFRQGRIFFAHMATCPCCGVDPG